MSNVDTDLIAYWTREAKAAKAEVARLRGVVERVEALADEWETPPIGLDLGERWVADLRTALEGAT